MLVTALKGLKVLDVACGSGDAQTLAVTENGERRSGEWRIHLILVLKFIIHSSFQFNNIDPVTRDKTTSL